MPKLFLSTFILVYGCLHAQLREFNIVEMPPPEVAVVQASVKFPDDALLLVYSDIEGLEFRSSLDKLDKQTYNAAASRYEILVKPNKQIIFAAKSGYIEAKITTINPSPKDIYYFKVEEKQMLVQQQSLPGTLQIRSSPSNADIYLNGFKVADKTPKDLEITGTTRIKLKKKDYTDFDTTVYVDDKTISLVNASMRPSILYLNIQTSPPNAQIVLNGRRIGMSALSNYKIDFTVEEKGAQTIEISLYDYETITDTILLQPSELPLDLSYTLKKLNADFTITSEPSGASVFIDGVYRGKTPYTGSKEYGSYEVYIQQEGFKTSEKKRMAINSARPQQVHFKLEGQPHEVESELANNGMKEIKIGNQIWLVTNLNVDRFNDGDLIPQAQSAEEWKRASEKKQAAWCYYGNDPKNSEKYGKLYNWYAVVDTRGLCPAGWHVPMDKEWTILTDYLGGKESAGGKLKSTSGWKNDGNGNNISGFSGLPGGYCYTDGTFSNVRNYAYWWSNSELNDSDAWARTLNNNYNNLYRHFNAKTYGFSVRCLKN